MKTEQQWRYLNIRYICIIYFQIARTDIFLELTHLFL